MKTVKVSELNGAALDWAVAKAAGCYTFTDAGGVLRNGSDAKGWHPSTDWSQGGPLIDQYRIQFDDRLQKRFVAYVGPYKAYGETHLIAACRAIVAGKIGDTIEIPDERA